MKKKAVLLINLGTPDALNKKAIARYLREFLNDRRVIDLPKLWRWLLVNLIIIPFRTKKTTAAYAKIWEAEGSPLLLNTAKITTQLANALGENYQVEFAMRYGKPSIKDTLAKFKHHDELTIIPLFPQYSSAANGSAIEKTLEELKKYWNVPTIKVIHDFYQHPSYIAAYAQTIKESIADKNIDLILFSYHGLPERHLDKSECTATCDKQNACPVIDYKNRFCYRSQCFQSTELIAKSLGLPSDKYKVAFQSRLGRTPWIKPYTDLLLPDEIKKGHQHVAVVCPSFVADCLETLEEVKIRTKEQWLSLGGKDFSFIPCINDSALFIKALKEMVVSD